MYKMMHASKAHLLCTDRVAFHLFAIEQLLIASILHAIQPHCEALLYEIEGEDEPVDKLTKALRDCGYDVRVSLSLSGSHNLLIQWSKPVVTNTRMEV